MITDTNVYLSTWPTRRLRPEDPTQLAEKLRAAGVTVVMHSGAQSPKAQMKKADASGARHALVFEAGQVTIKALRERDAPTQAVPLSDASAAVAAVLQALAAGPSLQSQP